MTFNLPKNQQFYYFKEINEKTATLLIDMSNFQKNCNVSYHVFFSQEPREPHALFFHDKVTTNNKISKNEKCVFTAAAALNGPFDGMRQNSKNNNYLSMPLPFFAIYNVST